MTGRHEVPTAQVPPPKPPATLNAPQAQPAARSQPRDTDELRVWLPRVLMLTNLLLLLLLASQLFRTPKYAYQTVSPSDSSFEEEMNKLGPPVGKPNPAAALLQEVATTPQPATSASCRAPSWAGKRPREKV